MKEKNNHGLTPCPNEDDRAVEQVFLRLGNVLAEVARDIVQRKANSSQDLAKDDISTNWNETGDD